MQDVYIITEEKCRASANKIADRVLIKKIYESPSLELTEPILIDMARSCIVEYFYVIATRTEMQFPQFDFSFKPDPWDASYVSIWNNETNIRLFNKDEVLKNPSAYTDKALLNGTVALKNINQQIFVYPIFDIIFLSYDEPYADENFNKLKSRFPRAERLHHVKGILAAHMQAARMAAYNKSGMFYVVDADAIIESDFNFDFLPDDFEQESVHVWHSRNPVNGLEYGYGGVKLFPTQKLLEYTGSPIDFTTSVSSLRVMETVSNITKFDVDPFLTWRGAFRECTKLASNIIPNQDNTETEERLRIWCTVGGNTEFGEFAIMGANEGAAYGRENINQPKQLGLINDYSWLEERFSA